MIWKIFLIFELYQCVFCRINHRQLILNSQSGWNEMYDLHDRQVQLDQLEIRRHAPGQAHKALPDSDPPKSLQYADESFQLSATSVSPSFAPLSTGVTAEPELLLSDASAPIKLTTVRLPNMHTLNRTFAHMFVGPRYHEKPTGKRRFQRLLRDQLAGAGYELIEQNFRVRHLQLSSPKSMAGKVMNQVGTNLIAILPGRHSAQAHQLASWASRERRHTPETLAGWRMSSKLLELLNFVRENKIDKRFFASPNVSTQPGHTPEVTNDQPATSGNESLHGDESSHAHPQRVRAPESDGVIVIGAHYDTVETCPGVNDNGSGSILLLELARALAPLRYKLKHSIMFVWFDFEEAGGLGSMAFVDHYLIPYKLKNKSHRFIGAFVMDMLLTFDTNNDTQFVPLDIVDNFPDAVNEMIDNGFKSDFLAIWLRNVEDRNLLDRIQAALVKTRLPSEYPLKIIPMPINMPAFNYTHKHKYTYRTFLRSDHSSFWFATRAHGDFSLPALLFTDLGPWRQSHRQCYHKECDDLRQLTAPNLSQLMRVLRLMKQIILDYEII